MTAAESLLYYLDAARTEEQRAYMASLEERGICIFCEEHVAEHQEHPVEHAGEHWFVTRNAYPYAGTVAHYLIVPHVHVTSFDQLPDAAGAELWAIKRRLRAELAPLATATGARSRSRAGPCSPATPSPSTCSRSTPPPARRRAVAPSACA